MEEKKENLFDCRCYEKNKVENIATIVERLIFKISWKPDGTKEDSTVDKDRLLRILLNPYVCSCFVRERREGRIACRGSNALGGPVQASL